MTEPKPTYTTRAPADIYPIERKHTPGLDCWCRPEFHRQDGVTTIRHHDAAYWQMMYDIERTSEDD